MVFFSVPQHIGFKIKCLGYKVLTLRLYLRVFKFTSDEPCVETAVVFMCNMVTTTVWGWSQRWSSADGRSNWLLFNKQVFMISISKFGPSNKCSGGHFGNNCSSNKIWRLILALMSAVWALIGGCDALPGSRTHTELDYWRNISLSLIWLDYDTCPVSTV